MQRKKKPNGLLISGLISALASLAIVAVAPSFAGSDGPKEKEETTASQSGATNTSGNDRKEGYENNSSEPQAPNQGKGADNDGDADSDKGTAYTEDNDTNDGGTKNNVADSGDNAHPSGKDRSVENGGSGNQGKAESNPDDSKGPMRYEGKQGDDKPNGPGGTDLADQDGNNGCGNDDDFNDDNNGWCGRPKKSTPPSKTCPDGSAMPASGKCNTPSDNNNVKPGKTCPEDGSMVQGKSCSEPDNDGRGPDRNESGRDKVEDGNNGCGNDEDKMDDSEGWCGNKPKDEVDGEVITRPTCPDGSVMPEGGNCGEGVPCPAGTVMDANGNCLETNPSTPDEEVLGGTIDRDENPSVDAEENPSVLGIRLSPALNKPVKVAGAVLPFTGGDVLVFLVLALALFASGMLIMRSTKKSHQEI